MCGIAGILSAQLDTQSIASALTAMQNTLNHRGPDGCGDYFSPCNTAALTHTRLSIIDLSNAGAQPMQSSNGRYVISFNGEIYNYQELRAALEAKDTVFKSQSDTEVILKLYEEYGSKCVAMLRGMFAFLIWDNKEKSGFAARDPLGVKPFYYWQSNDTFAFASEVRSIVSSGLSEQKISKVGLTGYFRSGSVPEPTTLIADIYMLCAGNHLHWKNGVVNTKKYWQLNFNAQTKAQTIDKSAAINHTRQALERSVKAHFVSDVPVGIFLSGGIDSTALVALAKKVTSAEINTYSIAFADPEFNEGEIAKKVADHFGTNHHELVMTPELAGSLFFHYLKTIDQPTIDGFNTFCIAKFAHEHNEKVVLSGLGGDELFAGYKSFTLAPKMAVISLATVIIYPLIWLCGRFVKRGLSPKTKRITDFLVKPGSLKAAHQSLRSIFSNQESKHLVNLITGEHPPKIQRSEITLANKWADKVSALELNTYMRNQLLRDSDVASMAWGLELRVPLVDQVLIDELSVIPASIRLQPGKKLLIDAVPEIPNWVINRPKQGFRFPFDKWFMDEGIANNRQILPDVPNIPDWIPLKPWYRRWSIVVLNNWMHRYAKQ